MEGGVSHGKTVDKLQEMNQFLLKSVLTDRLWKVNE